MFLFLNFGSIFRILDNSGARQVKVIKNITKNVIRYKQPHIFLVAVKVSVPLKKVAVKELHKALIATSRNWFSRFDGTFYRFSFTGMIIINDRFLPIGTRILNFVSAELKTKRFFKIASLAKGLL